MAKTATNPTNNKKLEIFLSNLGKLSYLAFETDNYSLIADLKASTNIWQHVICDSPIESIMLAEFIFMDCGYGLIKFRTFPRTNIGNWTIEKQKRFGKYTVDFCFSPNYGFKEKIIIVECDGHDFHEKTKEQVKHDKKRDRWFAAQDIKVLRFSGSEIYNNSQGCAKEVSDLLSRTFDNDILPYEISGN